MPFLFRLRKILTRMNFLKLLKPSSLSTQSSKMIIELKQETDTEPTEQKNENSILAAAINEGNEVQNTLKKYQEKEKLLESKIVTLEQKNVDFMNVLGEYDNIVKELLQERNIYREGVNILANHLAYLELAFNDIQLKYERAKKIVSGFEENERILKAAVVEYRNTQEVLENRFITLKNWCSEQLQEANKIINSLHEKHESEVYWLKAKIQSLEITKNTLEENFNQKCIENKRLETLYDSLYLIPEQDKNLE